MLIDARSIPWGAVLDADLCIVGAGPTGLTLARQIAERGRSVVVLEAGGSGAIDSVDALELEPSGTPLEPMPDSRWRELGGTAAIWNTRIRNRPAARYLRLTKDDFEERPWLPHSGWPFGIETLNPYYERAEQLVLQGGHQHAESQAEAWPFDPAAVITTRERFGFASVFTKLLPDALATHPGTKLVTNAMVTCITPTPSRSSVDHLTVRADGQTFTVRSKWYVLASGGIETARLLLLGDGGRALGNESDLVGRFYMDHPRVQLGYVAPFDPRTFDHASAYDIRDWNGRFIGGKVTLAEHFRREHRLLNGAAHLIPHPNTRDAAALEALKLLLSDFGNRRGGLTTSRHVPPILRGGRYLFGTGARLAVRQRSLVPMTANGGWSHLKRNGRRFDTFEVVYQAEQSPNSGNRVTLGSTRDEFGLRRAQVSSRWSDVDLDSIHRVTALFSQALDRAGVGRLTPSIVPGEEPSLYQVGGAHHHLGTTRMHEDPRRGVVNSQGRVHGVENLYIAGSSVFPTGGYANPTLTSLALALRLADHLSECATSVADTGSSSPTESRAQ